MNTLPSYTTRRDLRPVHLEIIKSLVTYVSQTVKALAFFSFKDSMQQDCVEMITDFIITGGKSVILILHD